MTVFNISIADINKHDGPDVPDSIHIDEPLTLVREPRNRFDSNAVNVNIEFDTYQQCLDYMLERGKNEVVFQVLKLRRCLVATNEGYIMAVRMSRQQV